MDINISLIIGSITFILTFIVDYFVILLPKYKVMAGKKTKIRKKEVNMMELQYLQARFQLDLFKVDLEYAIKWFAFINSFIIAFTSSVIILLPWNMIFQLMLGFVILLGLIYALYELLGRLFVKKGWKR